MENIKEAHLISRSSYWRNVICFDVHHDLSCTVFPVFLDVYFVCGYCFVDLMYMSEHAERVWTDMHRL